jgi:hypothetical protein
MDWGLVSFCVPKQSDVADATGSSTHLLLRLLVLWDLNLLLSLSEELSLLAGLDTLGLGEERVVDGLGNGNGGNVDLGRSSDNVCLVNSSEGDTVEPVLLVFRSYK